METIIRDGLKGCYFILNLFMWIMCYSMTVSDECMSLLVLLLLGILKGIIILVGVIF